MIVYFYNYSCITNTSLTEVKFLVKFTLSFFIIDNGVILPH